MSNSSSHSASSSPSQSTSCLMTNFHHSSHPVHTQHSTCSQNSQQSMSSPSSQPTSRLSPCVVLPPSPHLFNTRSPHIVSHSMSSSFYDCYCRVSRRSHDTINTSGMRENSRGFGKIVNYTKWIRYLTVHRKFRPSSLYFQCI